MLTVDAGLAYRDVLTSDWTTKFHLMEERPLRCALSLPKVNSALKGPMFYPVPDLYVSSWTSTDR